MVFTNASITGTLHGRLQHERMLISEPIQYWLALGIAEGMEYLHEKHITHGQLSSLNVLLDLTWTPKIANWTEFTLNKVCKFIQRLILDQDFAKKNIEFFLTRFAPLLGIMITSNTISQY